MIKRIHLLLALIFCNSYSFAQAPRVPSQIVFADITLKLDKNVMTQIQKKVNSLVQSQKHFNLFVQKSILYFPHIESIFKQAAIPQDLKYLALQESALTSDALSSSGAVGFWQFKAATAREVGLKIDHQVDERKNIIAATMGASAYLKKNNSFLKNWVYTLLSYNYGLTGANRHMDKKLKGVKKMTLEEGTPQYIIHFLAHKIAFEYKPQPKNFLKTYLIAYTHGKGKSLQEIASKTGADPTEILRYNKWLKVKQVPTDKTYWVMLPLSRGQIWNLNAQFDDMVIPYAWGTEPPPVITQKQDATALKQRRFPVIIKQQIKYAKGEKIQLVLANGIPAFIAEKGQNMLLVAKALKIGQKRLLKLNDMKPYDDLQEGKPYYLKRKKNKARTAFHTVQHGETTWKIAQKYGIKLKALLKKNRMDNSEYLALGRVLWLNKKRKKKFSIKIEKVLPLKTKTENSKENSLTNNSQKLSITKNGKYHTVVTGESLFTISKKYGVNIMDLQKWNHLDDKLNLKVGQVLVVSAEVAPSALPEDYDREQDFISVESTDTTVWHYESEQGAEVDSNPQEFEMFSEPAVEDVKKQQNPTDTDEEAKRIFTNHTVQLGETLWKIARTYQLSLNNLLNWNNLNESDVLQPGQILALHKPTDKTSKKDTKPEAVKLLYHTVQKGQTLSSIALNYQISVRELQEWNSLGSDYIQIGQQLRIRHPQPIQKPKHISEQTTGELSKKYHTVQKGETLFSISRNYGISINLLKILNNKTDNRLDVGEQLLIERP